MKKSTKIEKPTIRVDWRKDKGLNKEGMVTLNYFIRFAGKTAKKPTGVFLKPSHWDETKKMVRLNRCELLDKEWRNLESRMNKFRVESSDLRLRKNEGLTWDDIEDCFESRKFDSFFSYAEKFLNNRIIKPHTKIKYERNLKIFARFCESKKYPNLKFVNITNSLLSDFHKFLVNERGMKVDCAYNYHKNFKTILKEAKKEGLIDKSPYEMGFEPKKSNGTIEIEPLTRDEIQTIIEFEIPDDLIHLKRIRDYYVFMLNTGLRYGDFMSLKGENFRRRPVKDFNGVEIKMYYLELTQEKSERKVRIPLNLEARRIWLKYKVKNKNEKSGLVFTPITNQALNKGLKALANLVGIEKRLYCHLARHSFATNLRAAGISIEDISELVGHADIRMTKRYAKADNSRLVDAVCRLQLTKKVA